MELTWAPARYFAGGCNPEASLLFKGGRVHLSTCGTPTPAVVFHSLCQKETLADERLLQMDNGINSSIFYLSQLLFKRTLLQEKLYATYQCRRSK